MRAANKTGTNQFAERILDCELTLEIEPRRSAGFAPMHNLEVLRRSQFVSEIAEEENDITGLLEMLGHDPFFALDQTNHCHRRRGIDDTRWTLVVEGNVAADH